MAKARKRAWLIVLLDADNHTISQRIAQLDAGLTQATDIRLREMNIAEEAIGRLIARRNIETWILALTDVSANETEDYKSRKSPEEWAALVTSASVKLYEWTRPNTELSKSMIESLRRGIHELTHLEQVGR
ncbi:MAG: hypothetical protein ACLGRW_07710 [Acidobacteriota bacterium]